MQVPFTINLSKDTIIINHTVHSELLSPHWLKKLATHHWTNMALQFWICYTLLSVLYKCLYSVIYNWQDQNTVDVLTTQSMRLKTVYISLLTDQI